MKSPLFRLPPGVVCVKSGSTVILRGRKGDVSLKCSSSCIQRGETLLFSKRPSSEELSKFKHAIYGISLSYSLVLALKGVGYRVDKVDDKIVLKLGCSHTHSVDIPQDVDIKCIKNEIHLRSPHLVLLNSFASSLRKLRFPDSYKGSGVLYKNEPVRLKEGKKT